MSVEQHGATSTGALQLQDGDGDLPSLPTQTAVPQAAAKTPTNGAGQLLVEEVPGRVIIESWQGESTETTETTEMHAEVEAEGAESSEMYTEATADQLAAAASGESAYSDLRGIEGFEERTAEESAAASEGFLQEAGAVAADGQEFLPIIASLASTVLPTLASKVGPTLARGVMQKLTPIAKAAIRRRARAGGGGLLSILGKMLETAEASPESSPEMVDEALVTETAQIIEVIIGTDDRVRITQTQKIPWRYYCALKIYMPGNKVYRGTGFFISKRAVVTAGHCVYMHDPVNPSKSSWAQKIEVSPARNGTVEPFGKVTATTFRSTVGWVQGKKAASDYGCILLPPGSFSSQQLGSFGFGVFPTATLLAQRAVLAGYPGDKPFAELWGMGRQIKTVTADQLIYDIDTMGGQSGAPVYIKYQGKRYVVGIHNYGASSGNSATRITKPVFDNLKKWRNL